VPGGWRDPWDDPDDCAELLRATPERAAARPAVLERNLPAVQATYRRDLAESRQHACRDRAPWTREEDARLLRDPREPARDLAREFGRSLAAVSLRRSRLRHQPPANDLR
jgi:hypothetical protein